MRFASPFARKLRRFRFVVCCIPCALIACSGSGTPAAPTFGSPCSTANDCGFALVCGVDANGKGICVECTGLYRDGVGGGVPGPRACVGGRYVACADLPSTTCGCACPAGAYCAVADDGLGGTCTPTLPDGATCIDGAFTCASGLCYSCDGTSCSEDSTAGICSVPIGAPCTSGVACAQCITPPGQSTGWCSVSCSAMTTGQGFNHTTCPKDSVCLGSMSIQSQGTCYRYCTPAPDGGASGSDGCTTGTTCKPFTPASNDYPGTMPAYACQ
jgi:hypothetical protein